MRWIQPDALGAIVRDVWQKKEGFSVQESGF